MDARIRSLVKALIWNAIGFTSMALVGFLTTGSARLGGSMALINTVLGFGCYVIYERVWAGISWGRISAAADMAQISELSPNKTTGQAHV